MGHDMAKPATTFMKSRRSIAAPTFRSTPILADYIRDLRPAKWGSGLSLRSSNPEPLMSALGQKRTLQCILVMSALPPKADMDQYGRDVRFVPKADICSAAIRTVTRSPCRRRSAGAAARPGQAHLLSLG